MAGSELGVQDMFRTNTPSVRKGDAVGSVPTVAAGDNVDRGTGGITAQDTTYAAGWGKGPRAIDVRKYKYDRHRSSVTGAIVNFSASKVDRLDAEEAGAVLAHVHDSLGLTNEVEERIEAFDNALFLQHYLNGASMLQPGRGVLTVDGQKFDIASTLALIGEDRLRRFFRAYADDIVAVIRDILDKYDPYDFESHDKVGQIRQVAAARGMSKFPEYAADSAEASLIASPDVRRAIAASKLMVLPKDDQTAEYADSMLKRQVRDV